MTQALPERDQVEIQQLWAEYGAAFGGGDPARIARLYAADGDMIAVDGKLAAGPQAIEDYYRQHFAGASQAATIAGVELGTPRSISGDVAVMNGTWLVEGVAPGPFRVRSTFVVRREAVGWRYVAVRFAAALQPAQAG